MSNKVIVLSADAMVYEDIEYLKTLPNYKKYLEGGAEIRRVRTIYPSVTYPVHVTLATGAWPDRHGVPSNEKFHPGDLKAPWYMYHEAVKVKDIFDEVKEKGLSSSAVFWPVTALHPSVDYLLEWTQMGEIPLEEAFKRPYSNPQMLELLKKSFKAGETRGTHPGSDYFTIRCACDIIREYKPDLTMIHVANIDGYRHKTGIFSEKVTQGIKETDEFIGSLMKAMEDAGIAEDTNFFLTSDHGQMNITRSININVLLADFGLIKTGKNGELVEWDAYARSNGMSALIHLRNPGDLRLYEKTHALLRHFCEEGIYGIGQVYTEGETRETKHLGGDFSFVIETDGYSSFGENWNRPLIKRLDLADYRYGRASHGYLPEKGPQPMLIAKGPAIKSGIILETGNIIDQAPTFAMVLGVEMPQADGAYITEILA
jgi:predicted AlkP superfamily pyrophosphatase or phosphodiesterase